MCVTDFASVLGAAVSEHRLGPIVLAQGLATSFVFIGLFVATIGSSLGLDGGVFRTMAAILMMAVGTVLILPGFQLRLADAGAPFADWSERYFGGFAPHGLRGQFLSGLLLGAVWSPCVGPTLGSASILAAQSKDLPQVIVTMLLVVWARTAPLLALGPFFTRNMDLRDRLLATGKVAKTASGAPLIVIGFMVASGIDRKIETLLVDASPQWLINLTTHY